MADLEKIEIYSFLAAAVIWETKIIRQKSMLLFRKSRFIQILICRQLEFQKLWHIDTQVRTRRQTDILFKQIFRSLIPKRHKLVENRNVFVQKDDNRYHICCFTIHQNILENFKSTLPIMRKTCCILSTTDI